MSSLFMPTPLSAVKVAVFSLLAAGTVFGQTKSPAPPNLNGVYLVIPDSATAAGRKNTGAPAEITLQPEAAKQAKSANLKEDPARMCQPIGPFRMMARERNKIEIVNTGPMVAILFEDVSHGLMRKIDIDGQHVKSDNPDVAFTWMGDSVGHWERDTLVVDSIGFNDRTWLNEHGAPHSEALRLIERIRPIAGGRYLEYKMTAEDPKVLVTPYSYTRYFEKVNGEIGEDLCDYEE